MCRDLWPTEIVCLGVLIYKCALWITRAINGYLNQLWYCGVDINYLWSSCNFQPFLTFWKLTILSVLSPQGRNEKIPNHRPLPAMVHSCFRFWQSATSSWDLDSEVRNMEREPHMSEQSSSRCGSRRLHILGSSSGEVSECQLLRDQVVGPCFGQLTFKVWLSWPPGDSVRYLTFLMHSLKVPEWLWLFASKDPRRSLIGTWNSYQQ